jgi:hypothetical protein
MAGGTGEGSVDWGSWSPGCVPSEPGVANGNGVTSARLVPIARDLELNDVAFDRQNSRKFFMTILEFELT